MAIPISRNGKYLIRWFDENGKRRGATFIRYQDAVKALNKQQADVQAIKAGLRPRPPEIKFFEELADYWLRNRSARKRNPKDDKSVIKVHLLPFFADTRLTDITSLKIDKFESWMRERVSIKTLHNVLTLFISMLNLAVDMGWLVQRPKIKKPKVEERNYQYLTTKSEIRRLLLAAKDEPAPFFELVSMAIYTGMRAGELLGLHWEDVDFDNRLLTVHRTYTGPTKTGFIRRVPIQDDLLPILREWRLKCPSPLVLPNQAGRMHTPSSRILQETFHRCLERANLNKIRFHDLRHTFASHWMMAGGDLFKLQKILGHRGIEMTQRYAHLSPSAFSNDLDRISVFDGKDSHIRDRKIIPLTIGGSATSEASS